MPGEFTLKLSGPGIDLDQTISEEIAQRIVLTTFGSLLPPAPPRNRGGGTPGESPDADVDDNDADSIAEFVTNSTAKRGPDKITAIAHYLKKHGGQQTFTRPNIEQGFVDAGDSVPGNLPRDMKWAVKAGWIAHKPGQRGTFYVTGTGSKAVQGKFPKDMVKKSAIGRSARKRAKKKTAANG